jgi:hypothetical protein
MSQPSDPAQNATPVDRLREWFAGRPGWMNALMVFCFFMACIYMPWDIFIKPVAEDQEVWFGIMFTGWAAKLTAIPHWIVYAAGAYGLHRMSSWMWPWAAVYIAQVAIGMAVWPLMQFDGARAIGAAVVSFLPFAWLTWSLWNARERFQPSDGAANT